MSHETNAGQGLSLRAVFKGASLLFSGGFVVSIFAFAQGVCISRTLGPAQYGLLGLVLAFAASVKSFVGTSTSQPLTRYLVEYRTAADRDHLGLLLASVLAFDFSAALLTYVVILVGAPLAARHIVGGSAMIPLYMIYGTSVLCGFPMSTWFSVGRDCKRFAMLGAVPAVLAGLQLAAVVALWATSHLTLHLLVWVYLGTEVVRCSVVLVQIAAMLPTLYGLHLARLPYGQVWSRRRELRSMWLFLWSIYVSTSMSTFVRNGDVLLLGMYQTEAVVGFYRLAKNVVGIMQGLGQQLSSVIYQDFSELLASGQRAALRLGIRRLTRVWAAVVALGAGVLIVCSRPLITRVYGPAFAPAAPLFNVLVVGVCAVLVLFWGYSLLLALNEHRRYLYIQSACCAASALAMLLGARYFGAMGVAASAALMWWTLFLALAWQSTRILRQTAAEPV